MKKLFQTFFNPTEVPKPEINTVSSMSNIIQEVNTILHNLEDETKKDTCYHDWVDFNEDILIMTYYDRYNRNINQSSRILNKGLNQPLEKLDQKMLTLVTEIGSDYPVTNGKCEICNLNITIVCKSPGNYIYIY
jgi:hypothetical protein